MADTKVFRLSGNLTLEDVAHALEDYLQTQKHLETEGVSQSAISSKRGSQRTGKSL